MNHGKYLFNDLPNNIFSVTLRLHWGYSLSHFYNFIFGFSFGASRALFCFCWRAFTARGIAVHVPNRSAGDYEADGDKPW